MISRKVRKENYRIAIYFPPLVVSLLPLRSVREQTHLLTGGMWGPNIAVGSDNRDRSDVKRLVQVRAFALPAIPVFCHFFPCFRFPFVFLFLFFSFSISSLCVYRLFHYFKVETWILRRNINFHKYINL